MDRGDILKPVYIVLIVMVIILFIQRRNKMVWLKQFIESKKAEDRNEMLELAKRFIGKECIVYTFNTQLEGTIREVSEGAILIERTDSVEAVNLDFIVRIREYPRKGNGKKKSVVFD